MMSLPVSRIPLVGFQLFVPEPPPSPDFPDLTFHLTHLGFQGLKNLTKPVSSKINSHRANSKGEIRIATLYTSDA